MNRHRVLHRVCSFCFVRSPIFRYPDNSRSRPALGLYFTSCSLLYDGERFWGIRLHYVPQNKKSRTFEGFGRFEVNFNLGEDPGFLVTSVAIQSTLACAMQKYELSSNPNSESFVYDMMQRKVIYKIVLNNLHRRGV